MRCTQCDYPLWNLATRACPECGSSFRPSAFQFQPNTVRFCCPQCDQAYYGTGADGLLVPRSFTCRQCEQPIDIDEMVLRPEGTEASTIYDQGNPWLARDNKTFKGRVAAWFKTCGRALGRPQSLMRSTGLGQNGQAWWFLTLTIVLGSVIAVLPMMCLFGVLPMGIARNAPGGPGIGQFIAIAGGVSLVTLVFVIVTQFLFVAIWGVTAHGILAVTGGAAHPMSRTFQCLCYSGGTFITLAVPFVGQYVATIWWIVSAVLMVREGQKVSGGRASLAILTFPIVSVVLFCGGYLLLVVAFMNAAATGNLGNNQSMFSGTNDASVMAIHMGSWQSTYGDWPDHALRVSVDGTLGPGSFVSGSGLTTQEAVPVGDGTLADFRQDGPGRNRETLDAIVAAWPENVIAHRVGDFVFTYPEVDPIAHPDVWIVVLDPQPDLNPSPAQIAVAFADGSTRSFPAADFPTQMTEENARRRDYGLPELDVAFNVTAEAPMTGP